MNKFTVGEQNVCGYFLNPAPWDALVHVPYVKPKSSLVLVQNCLDKSHVKKMHASFAFSLQAEPARDTGQAVNCSSYVLKQRWDSRQWGLPHLWSWQLQEDWEAPILSGSWRCQKQQLWSALPHPQGMPTFSCAMAKAFLFTVKH